VSPPEVGVHELIERLQALRTAERAAALVFDADGTLWSGDVSEDVFGYAVENGLLRAEAADALAKTARESGFDAEGSPSAIGKRLFRAYVEGRFGEREVCEVMTWCYAGFTPNELFSLARRVLAERELAGRVNRRLEPILEYARRTGLRALVVSASPQPIVEVAAELWGFSPQQICGARAELDAGRYAARLAGPIPYAEQKCPAARALIGDDADWLASFGDNVFDVEMLCAARLGVAVNPKRKLRTALPNLKNVVLLT